MKKLLGLFVLIAVLSSLIMGFDELVTPNAPIPGGGSIPMDFTGMYGPMDNIFQYLDPYALKALVLSVIGFCGCLIFIKRKSY